MEHEKRDNFHEKFDKFIYWDLKLPMISLTKQIYQTKKFISKYLRFITFNKNDSGSKIIEKILKKNNVDTVFGYTGGAILPVTDIFYQNKNIKYVMNRNELCVGHAAEGFAKVSGKPGIIVTTSGPGVTNLVTPLQNAKTDGTPLVVLTGQVQVDKIGTDAFQECPALELTKPCTKWNYQPKNVSELINSLNKAFEISMDGRKGPVHIDLPKDVITSTLGDYECKNSGNKKSKNEKSKHKNSKNKNSKNKNKILVQNRNNLDIVIKLIEKCEKPIIIAGNGCVDSSKELRKFIELTNIPITTTIHGLGVVDEKDNLSLEMLGMHGSRSANYLTQKADLILSIGSRFDDRITGELDSYAPNARLAEKEKRGGIIHFDIDTEQIKKVKSLIKPTYSILQDSQVSLETMNNYFKNKKNKKKKKWLDKVSNFKNKYPFSYEKHPNKLKTQQVIEEIYEQTKKTKTYITTGVGNHQMMCCQFYKWKYPKTMVTSGSLGTMGFGVPSAVGVQLAMPEEQVICIDGDGSFMMTFNDLATIHEHNLPIKIFIMNDGRQQMVHIWQKLFFGKRFISTDNLNPNFNTLSDAFFIENLSCDNIDDLHCAVQLSLEHPGPFLLNCIVEPDMCTPLVLPGNSLDNMLMSDKIVLKGHSPN